MTKFFLPLMLLFFVARADSARNDDDPGSAQNAAVEKAATKCDVSVSEMSWMRDLIVVSQTHVSKKGPFYAVETSAGTVIAHQPMVSSCYACLLYSCDGSVPTLSATVLSDELIPGMTEENKIFAGL